jgi:hypothetical protein
VGKDEKEGGGDSLANPYPRTPAMAAGVSDHVWTIGDIVKLNDGELRE